MGCDIHLFVERFESGAWRCLPPPRTDTNWRFGRVGAESGGGLYSLLVPNADPGVVAVWDEEYERKYRYLASWWQLRAYHVFGMLAGVRRVNACNRDCQIDDPRGLPPGASEPFRGEVERDDRFGHSHSWVRLDELLESMELCTESCPSAEWDDLVAGDGQRPCEWFWEFVRDELVPLGDPSEIRVVFFFDS